MKSWFRVLYVLLIALGAAVAAIGMGAIVLAILGKDPLAVYTVILTEPLRDMFGLTEIAVRMTPLILVALGIAISFRSGILNIGAEGQIQMGVIAAAATAIFLPGLPKGLAMPLSLLAGTVAGALWAGIAGWLRARLKVSELLSTVMLNYIAAQLYGFLLRGPMIDPAELQVGSGTPQSVRLPRGAWIDRIIPGTRLHYGLVIALVAAVLVYILLWRTRWGYEMRAAGAEPKAARYGGIAVESCLIGAMVLAGAFAGLAGAVEVTGVHRRAIEGISSGYGFSGIVVALFGGLHPAGIVPSAFFFGLLLIGADMTQRIMTVPANMVLVLQGAVILSIISAKVLIADKYLFERFARSLSRRVAKRETGEHAT
ncbi:MAG: ABC transporter permease [Spirochaetaceae bacterium]|nr:ABC transporter permease [Spirochaetaceae bacterium]